jgi:DNA primase
LTTVEAGIGACVKGKMAGRVVIPICGGRNNKLVGWQARSWTDSQNGLRYYTSPNFKRAEHVYNEAALYLDTDEPCMVVEGLFDALPYWPHAVALLGKPSEGQINMLANTYRPLCVVLDGDAWLESEMLCLRLRIEGVRASWIRLPPKKDPADLSVKDLKSLVRNASFA